MNKLSKIVAFSLSLVLLVGAMIFNSCTDDDDDDDDGPGYLTGLCIDEYGTGRAATRANFIFDKDESGNLNFVRVPTTRFQLMIQKVYSSGRKYTVRFSEAGNDVRMLVFPGTGNAIVTDGDIITVTKSGTFTVYVGVCSDKDLLTVDVQTVDQVLRAFTDGKISNWVALPFVATEPDSTEDVPNVVTGVTVSAPTTNIIKQEASAVLQLSPTAILTYSKGDTQQVNIGSGATYVFSSDVRTDSSGFALGTDGKRLATINGASIVLPSSDGGTGVISLRAAYDPGSGGQKVFSNEITISILSNDDYTQEETKQNKLDSLTVTLVDKDGAAIADNEIKASTQANLKVMANYTGGVASEDVSSKATFSILSGGDATQISGRTYTAPLVDNDSTATILANYGGKSKSIIIKIKKRAGTDPVIPGTKPNPGESITTGGATININFGAVTSAPVTPSTPDTPVTPSTPSEGTGTDTQTDVDTDDKITVNPAPSGKVGLFIKADSAPTVWAWEAGAGGKSCSELEKDAWPGAKAVSAEGYMNDGGTGWYVRWFSTDSQSGKAITMKLNGGGEILGKPLPFYYDGTNFYTKDPTVAPKPSKPSIKISPASGKVSSKSTITVTINKNLTALTAGSITVNSAAKFNFGTTEGTNITAKGGTFNIKVADLSLSDGASIAISVSATNKLGVSTASASLTLDANMKEDVFTWDNVYCYFVLTDRFNNGDTTNDHSYGRQSGGSIPEVATFHGGDLKGLTQKIDYLDKLGVNAIWITAPYEQMHGWCDGKDSKFPHYAFHGYYTLDWTSMDANMGTLEEYRTFINTCHSKGIRVIMDVVMNHTGYNTVNDMVTYDFGGFKGAKPAYNWCAATGGLWSQGDGAGVDWASPSWGKWWGCWVRAFDGQFGFAPNGSGDICMSLAGLPDIVTENTNKVTIPTFLRKKWTDELTSKMASYKNPSVAAMDFGGMSGDWRADSKGAPADYLVAWLSAWVRELGIDGFRCDTAKHVHMNRWGQLKKACEAALKAWRSDSTKSKGVGTDAASWTQSFWMTGECFGWSSTAGQGDYYSTGGFDSMINFSFNSVSGSKGRAPTTGDWNSYININKNQDSDGNGNRNSVLSYVSSHDTGLHRATGSTKLATLLGLLPGGVQVYYGDESDRPECDGKGDADMATRGNMNFLSLTDPKIKQWSKIGKFRKYNPAVGAGTGTGTDRTYKDNHVLIAAGGSVTVPAGDYWNWYTGAKVSAENVNGTVEAPALISNKDPNDYADAKANFQ